MTATRAQRVVVEHTEDGWMVMHHDGRVALHATPDAALAAIQREALRRNPGATITSIEWRGVPEGWTPPAGRA